MKQFTLKLFTQITIDGKHERKKKISKKRCLYMIDAIRVDLLLGGSGYYHESNKIIK